MLFDNPHFNCARKVHSSEELENFCKFKDLARLAESYNVEQTVMIGIGILFEEANQNVVARIEFTNQYLAKPDKQLPKAIFSNGCLAERKFIAALKIVEECSGVHFELQLVGECGDKYKAPLALNKDSNCCALVPDLIPS